MRLYIWDLLKINACLKKLSDRHLPNMPPFYTTCAGRETGCEPLGGGFGYNQKIIYMEKRMKKALILSLLYWVTLPFAHAEVFTCTDRYGNKVYTQNAGSANCKKADIGRPSIYSAEPAKPVHYTPPAPAPEPAPDPAYQAAEKKVKDAQRALEEGKKVRYGNERNYVRYLERIAGLEAEVKKAQDELNGLSDGGAVSE
ncbi:DUF4124 domain-containing protein [Neisseria wadsworthii]|uniref:DUF4124 domain-containing protein n=1 Tax=Neisseria wadsworthii 9715 TaxID=1030841 RepID=G4CRP0_9NEIS|nr:DUF4124 domain-containing protein [Neisseria wadsworthii]EGZ45191.1 hypothetical protein HMPREF9370_1750 [Neisseria wadsworthii 9715]